MQPAELGEEAVEELAEVFADQIPILSLPQGVFR